MKKLAIIAVAGLTLAACNRDISQAEPTEGKRMSVRNASEIGGELHTMDETVNINGKNLEVPLSYTYKAFAEGPSNLAYTQETNTGIVTGFSNLAQATAVFPVDDFLFVTWHLEDDLYGGAVSCYRYNSGTQSYDYISVAEFDDTDFHELVASKNSLTGHYEIFVVGQRSPSTSGYLLNNHRGAIVGKLLFDYINNTFDLSAYKELPLPGYGGDDIITSAGQYFIATGNGTGASSASTGSGVYKTDRNLTNVSEAWFDDDVVGLEADPFNTTPTSAGYAILRRQGSFYDLYPDESTTNPLSSISGWTQLSASGGIDNERKGLCFVPATYDASGNVTSTDIICALSTDGVVHFETSTSTVTQLSQANLYSTLSVAYDHSARIIYLAGSDQGLHMIAAKGYNGGVLISDYDLIGIFVPPTTPIAAAPGFNVKDVSVYLADNLAIAVGGEDGAGSPQKGGVYFVRKN